MHGVSREFLALINLSFAVLMGQNHYFIAKETEAWRIMQLVKLILQIENNSILILTAKPGLEPETGLLPPLAKHVGWDRQ